MNYRYSELVLTWTLRKASSVASKHSHYSSYEFNSSVVRYSHSVCIRSSSCVLSGSWLTDPRKYILHPDRVQTAMRPVKCCCWSSYFVAILNCVFPRSDCVWYHFYTYFYIQWELVQLLHTENIDRFRGRTLEDDLSTEQAQIEVCWETTMGSYSHCLGRPLVLLDHGRKDENAQEFIDRHFDSDASRQRKCILKITKDRVVVFSRSFGEPGK